MLMPPTLYCFCDEDAIIGALWRRFLHAVAGRLSPAPHKHVEDRTKPPPTSRTRPTPFAHATDYSRKIRVPQHYATPQSQSEPTRCVL